MTRTEHSPHDPQGRLALADNPDRHWNKYRVGAWEDPALSVIGATRPGSGSASVADPRVPPARVAATNFPSLGVVPWDMATGAITGQALPANGRYTVADPRVAPLRPPSTTFASLGVVPWDQPMGTVTTQCKPGNGPYSVADPRLHGAVGLLPFEEAMKLLVGPGPWAIVDPSSDGPPLMVIHDLLKAPPFPLAIVAEDGTWHRPITTLELGVLQSLPSHVDGAPLALTGGSTEQRKQIGNLVPPDAAEAIAVQMLVTLLSATVGGFALSSGGDVWVDRAGTEMLDG